MKRKLTHFCVLFLFLSLFPPQLPFAFVSPSVPDRNKQKHNSKSADSGIWTCRHLVSLGKCWAVLITRLVHHGLLLLCGWFDLVCSYFSAKFRALCNCLSFDCEIRASLHVTNNTVCPYARTLLWLNVFLSTSVL